MQTKFKHCPALKSFVDYWDEWHKQWHSNAINTNHYENKIIDCWGFPTPIWRYFPEPYWGNPYTENLVAVFLNINPGAGGDDQDILQTIVNDPIKTYNLQNKIYSRTVEILSEDNNYPTTDYFRSKRVSWLKKLLECLKRPPIPDLSVQNIICADLIPWHTPTVDAFVAKYIDEHRICILNNVIDPIVALSQCAVIKGLVFAKGAVIESLLIKLIGEPTDRYYNGEYRISVFEYTGARIIVLIGGQGMRLPNPCNSYVNSENDFKKTIAEIVADQIKDTEDINNKEKQQDLEGEDDAPFDTVIVPAGTTLSDIKKHNRYLCPLYRELKKDILYIAFYVNKIVVGYGKIVSSSTDPYGNIVYQLDSFHSLAIPHIRKYAYVQNRVYCNLEKLKNALTTAQIR